MAYKRIVVISDTHGKFSVLKKIVDKYMSEATCFIHTGDGQQEVLDIMDLYPMLKIHPVRGNCDYLCDFPVTDEICVQNKRIVFTHGHEYAVNYGEKALLQLAEKKAADIILYGHTHVSCDKYIDGVHIINPGSASLPRDGKASFAIVDVSDNGVVANIMDVDKVFK